ncbi:hypothetical protein B0H13DRAFT_2265730 [Mycena leptocephala]|nr:hypothetical protein B0H13DRAFT_2265730 [Mycena leptocephala]
MPLTAAPASRSLPRLTSSEYHLNSCWASDIFGGPTTVGRTPFGQPIFGDVGGAAYYLKEGRPELGVVASVCQCSLTSWSYNAIIRANSSGTKWGWDEEKVERASEVFPLCNRTTSERMSCGIRESSSRRRRGRLECEADQLETEHIRIKFKPRVGRRDAETQLRRVSRLVLWIEPRMVLTEDDGKRKGPNVWRCSTHQQAIGPLDRFSARAAPLLPRHRPPSKVYAKGAPRSCGSRPQDEKRWNIGDPLGSTRIGRHSSSLEDCCLEHSEEYWRTARKKLWDELEDKGGESERGGVLAVALHSSSTTRSHENLARAQYLVFFSSFSLLSRALHLI